MQDRQAGLSPDKYGKLNDSKKLILLALNQFIRSCSNYEECSGLSSLLLLEDISDSICDKEKVDEQLLSTYRSFLFFIKAHVFKQTTLDKNPNYFLQEKNGFTKNELGYLNDAAFAHHFLNHEKTRYEKENNTKKGGFL